MQVSPDRNLPVGDVRRGNNRDMWQYNMDWRRVQMFALMLAGGRRDPGVICRLALVGGEYPRQLRRWGSVWGMVAAELDGYVGWGRG
jgi:hypothetical protein